MAERTNTPFYYRALQAVRTLSADIDRTVAVRAARRNCRRCVNNSTSRMTILAPPSYLARFHHTAAAWRTAPSFTASPFSNITPPCHRHTFIGKHLTHATRAHYAPYYAHHAAARTYSAYCALLYLLHLLWWRACHLRVRVRRTSFPFFQDAHRGDIAGHGHIGARTRLLPARGRTAG